QPAPMPVKMLAMIGSTNSTPTVAAIAPAPERSTKPNATPMSANTDIEMDAARIGRVDAAGSSQPNAMSRPAKIGEMTRAAAKKITSEVTNITAATTIALAASAAPRDGFAVSVERIIPEEYSPVTEIAPRMPASSIVNWMGETTAWMGSNPGTSIDAATSTAMPIV